MLKGLKASEALARLEFVTKSAAKPLAQVIKSALANGKNPPAGGQAPELTIKNILVDEGLKMKRRDTSHGARYGGGVKIKRTSHVTVILTEITKS
jgi:large subunit ribosomal protein L22